MGKSGGELIINKQRKGQFIINKHFNQFGEYGVIENWLYNLSNEEFDKIMSEYE